ncbi:FAD-dependent monooxygenase [Streptomyces sp. NPDC002088]|uniref:FAD-dependent monooxygenase n=1 Tax=Streptomyces sp. NPDC002088 TaxID=3154665 RepID=UPI0033272055
MPPTGCLGGTTGIADAHDLARKPAAVPRGTVRPGLPATYETERRPAAERTMRQAYLRGRTRWRLPGGRRTPPDGPFLGRTARYRQLRLGTMDRPGPARVDSGDGRSVPELVDAVLATVGAQVTVGRPSAPSWRAGSAQRHVHEIDLLAASAGEAPARRPQRRRLRSLCAVDSMHG